MPGASSVAGAGTCRAAEGAVCACPEPHSPASRPLFAEHKSCEENLTQSDSTLSLYAVVIELYCY